MARSRSSRIMIRTGMTVVLLVLVLLLARRLPDETADPKPQRTEKATDHRTTNSSDSLQQSSISKSKDSGRTRWQNGTITGIVKNWPEMNGVSNVSVSLFHENDLGATAPVLVTQTQTDGTYTLQHVPKGNYRLIASQSEYASEEAWLSLDARHANQSQDFLLKQGGRVFGTVTYSDGRPAVGKTVSAGRMLGTACQTTVDESGRYELNRVPPGRGINIGVVLTGKLSMIHPFSALDAGAEIGPIDFVIGETGMLRGIVRNRADDTPIPYATVRITITMDDHFGQLSVKTDDQGVFEIDGMPTCLGSVSLSHPDYFNAEERLKFNPLTRAGLLEFYMDKMEAWSVGGRVKHADKTPFEGVRVIMTRPIRTLNRFGDFSEELQETITEDNGEFVLKGETQKTATLMFFHDDTRLEVSPEFFHVEYKPGKDYYQEFTVIEPDMNLVMNGTVKDDLGEPISDAHIAVTSIRNTFEEQAMGVSPDPVVEATTDAQGHYSIEKEIVFMRSFSIRVRKDGYKDVLDELRLTSSENLPITRDYVMGNDVAISGTVVDVNGIPIAGAAVRVTDSKLAAFNNHVITGADGTFTLSGLEPGSQDVMATIVKQIPMGMKTVYGVTAPCENLVIVMGFPGKISVSVTDKETGLPVENYWVRYTVTNPPIRKPIDFQFKNAMSLDGTITLSNVAFGQLEISIQKNPHDRSGESKTVTFTEAVSPMTFEFSL